MADRPLVLCVPLCFIVSKLGKVGKHLLIKSVIDNCEPEVISSAKRQLLKDIETMQLPEQPPRVPARRDGITYIEREVKDIFDLIYFLDNHKQLEALPRYVTDDPDNMPTIRVFSGDLIFMNKRFEKMEEKMEIFGSMLAAMMDGVRPRLDSQSWPGLQSTGQPAGREDVYNSRPATASATASVTVGSENNMTIGKSSLGPLNDANVQSAANANAGFGSAAGNLDQLFHVPNSNWAQLCSTPNHDVIVGAAERQSTGVDNVFDNALTDNNDQYTLVGNNKKRRRTETREKPGSNLPVVTDSETAARNTRRRRPLVVGHAEAPRLNSLGHTGLMAAPKLPVNKVNKAVFYLDNIDPCFSADDVTDFVTSLSVRVLSCFSTKARKRRFDLMPDRTAFRLCINDDDRDNLLDDQKWPKDVTVSEWFFKPKDENKTTEKRVNSVSRLSRSRDNQPGGSGNMSVLPIATSATTSNAAAVTAVTATDDSNVASVASAAASPVAVTNRFSVLESTGDDASTAASDADSDNDHEIDDAMEADETIHVVDLSESTLDKTLSLNNTNYHGAVC